MKVSVFNIFFLYLLIAIAIVVPLFPDVVAEPILLGEDGVELATDFDNGWLARVEESDENVFECWPYDSEHYRWGWLYLKSKIYHNKYDHTGFCFHFKLTGCKDKIITFNFHVKDKQDEDNDSVLYANPDFPVFSYDADTWVRTNTKEVAADPDSIGWYIVTVEQEFTEDTVYVAFQYPYTNTHLDKFISHIAQSPFCTVEIAGQSTEGRNIRQITVTNPDITLNEKLVAWVFGLQHVSELGSGWGIQYMIDFLLTDDPLARKIRDTYEMKFIPIVNVDSVHEGMGRQHTSGNNLNRLWETDHVETIPEIDSIRYTLDYWVYQKKPIDLFLDIHGFSAKDGYWTLLMPEEVYSSSLSDHYKDFVSIFRRHISHSDPGLLSIPGLSCNAGLRRYGAVSFCIDGYAYDFRSSKNSDISSYYELDERIWPIEELKACSKTYMAILGEYADKLLTETDIRQTPTPLSILFPNYPNPFNNETAIRYLVSEQTPVNINIHNITGQLVRTLENDPASPGYHDTVWDGHDNSGRLLESGVYFATFSTGSFTTTRKLLFLK
ncbi:M14 family zinc carboxypeptidase [Candidatus Latescibacterota bacterium]